MILKKIGELSARGPDFSNVGFQLDQFFLHGSQLLIGQVVEVRGVGLVVAENLRRHVDGGEIVPNGNLPLVPGIPKDSPGIRRLYTSSRIVKKWIRTPHERHAGDLAVGLNQRQITKLGRKLRVRRQFRKVERRSQ